MSVFVILNHDLTEEQMNDLLQFGQVVALTPEQKRVWGQVPAEGDAYDVRKHIADITSQISKHDAVICQGEFSAFVEVYKCCQLFQKPLFVACSRRETVEEVQDDGSVKKVAVFRHVQFRVV